MRNYKSHNWHGVLLAAIIAVGGGISGTIHAQTNSPAPGPGLEKPPMHSRIFQWSDMEARPSNIGAVRNAFDAPTATLADFSCHITTLDPGKEPHPAHRHPEEELVIVKEGTLEVALNGVTNHVSAGGMVFCASNELHGWRNTSTSPVTYYVIHFVTHDLTKPVSAGEQKPNP